MKKTKSKDQIPAQLLIGVLVCAAAAVVGMVLSTALILGGILNPKAVVPVSGVICGLSSFAGAMVTAARAKQKKLIYGAAVSGVFLLFLLMGNLLFVPGPPAGFFRNLLPVLMGALAAGLLSGRKKRTAIRRRK